MFWWMTDRTTYCVWISTSPRPAIDHSHSTVYVTVDSRNIPVWMRQHCSMIAGVPFIELSFSQCFLGVHNTVASSWLKCHLTCFHISISKLWIGVHFSHWTFYSRWQNVVTAWYVNEILSFYEVHWPTSVAIQEPPRVVLVQCLFIFGIQLQTWSRD